MMTAATVLATRIGVAELIVRRWRGRPTRARPRSRGFEIGTCG
jgi:hypothetical protein